MSTLQKDVFAALRTGAVPLALPVTAASGDALDALLAGARDARSTVVMPMDTPAAILGILTEKITSQAYCNRYPLQSGEFELTVL